MASQSMLEVRHMAPSQKHNCLASKKVVTWSTVVYTPVDSQMTSAPASPQGICAASLQYQVNIEVRHLGCDCTSWYVLVKSGAQRGLHAAEDLDCMPVNVKAILT